MPFQKSGVDIDGFRMPIRSRLPSRVLPRGLSVDDQRGDVIITNSISNSTIYTPVTALSSGIIYHSQHTGMLQHARVAAAQVASRDLSPGPQYLTTSKILEPGITQFLL